jgi:phosphoribosylanthranilate isomerase
MGGKVPNITGRTGIPVIKAIKVGTPEDIGAAAPYHQVASHVMFDTKVPETLVNALPGGNGIAFDWSLLAQPRDGKPFILSGGLNADNVAEAIRITKAPIVDVSSGVERAPGEKDVGLIRKFIEAARAAR